MNPNEEMGRTRAARGRSAKAGPPTAPPAATPATAPVAATQPPAGKLPPPGAARSLSAIDAALAKHGADKPPGLARVAARKRDGKLGGFRGGKRR